MAINILENITPQWNKIIANEDMLHDLKLILEKLNGKYYPEPEKIFEFARYSLNHAKVVILAMDPYPNGEADGLAFSTKLDKCPTSLNRILNVLKANGLIDKITKNSYNLNYLAAQGIILLNSALTVQANMPGSHMKLWSKWTDKLIQKLSEDLPPVIWCLWGNDAYKKKSLINAKHDVLTHCHPVAMTNPSFSQCNHFKHIAGKHPEIVWDFSKTETHLYTDCSARNNQSPNCRASWGVVCERGILKGKKWGGEVLSKEMIQKGEPNPSVARPTNIRGEGMALINALRLVKRLPVKVIIFTDSKFWIDMLEKYIPSWIEKSISFDKKANPDISEEIWKLYSTTKAELKFINCWHDRQRPDNGIDLENWLGNQAAERQAESVLNLI